MTTAYINRIATAVPPHDIHHAFISFAATLLPEGTKRNLFRRMARPIFVTTPMLGERMDQPCGREDLRACVRDVAETNR